MLTGESIIRIYNPGPEPAPAGWTAGAGCWWIAPKEGVVVEIPAGHHARIGQGGGPAVAAGTRAILHPGDRVRLDRRGGPYGLARWVMLVKYHVTSTASGLRTWGTCTDDAPRGIHEGCECTSRHIVVEAPAGADERTVLHAARDTEANQHATVHVCRRCMEA